METFLDITKRVKQKIYQLFKEEKSGHDINHLERVLKNAIKIQKEEGGDLFVIEVSALLHDIHRLMSNQQKRYVPPEESLGVVEQILADCDIDYNKQIKILDIIKNHENKQNKNFSLETLIIQDADALDAIGEIGLERTLKYCKFHNIPITDNSKSLDCDEYIPDINPISTCHYIYRTMIPNAKNLYTKTAQILAKEEIEILEEFIKNNYKRESK